MLPVFASATGAVVVTDSGLPRGLLVLQRGRDTEVTADTLRPCTRVGRRPQRDDARTPRACSLASIESLKGVTHTVCAIPRGYNSVVVGSSS